MHPIVEYEMRRILSEIANLAHIPHLQQMDNHITARVRLRHIESLAIRALQILDPEDEAS